MRVSDRIRYVGVNDLKKQLFENQWPLPFGITYNSYLIVDEKIALIDTAAAGFKEDFFKNIKAEIEDRAIERVVMNMRKIGYTSEQIAKAVEITVKEVEIIIKKNESVMV